MIEQVGELICLQENQPGTSKSTRMVVEELKIHRSSVQRIVKRDLVLFAFRRVPAQIISEVWIRQTEMSWTLWEKYPSLISDAA